MNKPPNQWGDAPVDATVVDATVVGPPKGQPRPPGPSDPVLRMVVPVDRSAWAIVAGYLGLISIIPIFGPLAVVASIVAIKEIKKSQTTPTPRYGMGRAIFGLVMGLFGCLLLLLIIAVIFAN
jgi:hypothetical protein